jgi:hypothetical protein
MMPVQPATACLGGVAVEMAATGLRRAFPVPAPYQGLNPAESAAPMDRDDNGAIAMNVLFNNPMLYVIDYPGHDALEILDKRNGRMGLLRGATADRMRDEFSQFLMQEHDEEEFENFIDSYGAILDHPVSRH